MLRSVFGKALTDQRHGIVAWAIGIALVGVMYAAFFPSMRSPEMAAAIEAFPPGLLEALGMADLASPAGYLEGSVYGLLGPALMIIYATILGGRAIAGEEEAGRLDLLLAHPVQRWRVVVERWAAMVVALALVGLVLFAALAALATPFELDEIGTNNIAAMTAQLGLLALLFGTLALAVGALTGNRGLAVGVVAIVAVTSYFANNLAPMVDGLDLVARVSPFGFYLGGQPLVNGWQWADAAVLAGISLVLVVVAAAGLERRDIAV